MNLRILTLVLACAPALAVAQPPQTPPPVLIEFELALRLEAYLTQGGTFAHAASLRSELLVAAAARQREMEVQARIAVAVEEVKTKADKAKATPKDTLPE